MNYPAAELRGIVSRKFLSHNIVTAQQAARYYVTISFNSDLQLITPHILGNMKQMEIKPVLPDAPVSTTTPPAGN